MLTSKHESRKHGVIDGRVTKKSGGLGYLKNKSPVRLAKGAHLLTPSYIADRTKPVALPPAIVQETKPEVPAKPRDKPQSAQTTTEIYNELCPLMTEMVEDELKNIMIKVWQTLPDDAPAEIEQLVIDKLKGAAGDDLRNTIGLNVTKRLLNVHNGILVKFVIYSTITASEILEFTKKHRVYEFKHVQRWTYAGRMASWAELDDLYTNNNLKCGNSRVKVSPVYSFLKCPPSLRTIFDGSQSNSKDKKIEMEIARKTMKSDEGRVIVTADKVFAEAAKREITKNYKDPETKEVKTEAKKTESASKVSTEAKNVAAPKNTLYNTTKKQLITTNIVKKDIGTPKQSKTEVQSKATVANTTNDKKQTITQSQTNKEPAKTVANKASVTTNITKHNTVSKDATKVETEKTVAIKPITSTPKKDIVANKAGAQKVEISKSVANKPSASDKTTASANATKIETTKSVANKPSVASNTTNKNTASPKPNATKVETAKAVANKSSVATNQNTASPKPNATKVETAKAVANKSSVATNQNTASPKPNATRVETAKSVANKPSVATNQNTASPKPNATKVETAKSVANKPLVTTNTTNKNTVMPKPNATKGETAKSVANKPAVKTSQNTASPKPSTPKVEAKAVANKPAVSINTKKVPNEKKLGIAVKEPIKTPIKEPVSANSAKTGEAKKLEAKPAKVETPTRIQSKPAANKQIVTPKKEIVKSKPIENRKSGTKVALKELKPPVNTKDSKIDPENDFDELDDHDILALLSSGIVLDECSGSDDD